MFAYHHLGILIYMYIAILNLQTSTQEHRDGVTASTRTGFLGFVFGQLSQTEEYDSVYDYTEYKRFAAIITRVEIDPYVEHHVQVIEQPGQIRGVMAQFKDYVWVIDLDKQQCLKVMKDDYPFHLDRCMPEYLRYEGKYYSGKSEYTYRYAVMIPKKTPTYGAKSELFADGYYVVIPNKYMYPTYGVYSLSVGQACLPHSETFVGQKQVRGISQNVASKYDFYNYTVGIENPDKYFTVPDYCQNNEKGQKGKSIFSWW